MKSEKSFFIVLILLLTLFASVSCHKIRTEIPETEQELPDMIMRNATYTFGQPDRKPLLLHADKITIWNEDHKTELANLSFEQKSKDGESIELSGSCDYAISYNNEKVYLKGNIKLHKNTDNITIECQNLEWNDESQTIKTNDTVFIAYQDGTTITATGFSALLDENIYQFNKLEHGTYEEQ